MGVSSAHAVDGGPDPWSRPARHTLSRESWCSERTVHGGSRPERETAGSDWLPGAAHDAGHGAPRAMSRTSAAIDPSTARHMLSMEWPSTGAWPSSAGADAAVSAGAAIDMGIEIVASVGTLVCGPVTACMPKTPTTSTIPSTQRATALRVAPRRYTAVGVMASRVAQQNGREHPGGVG